MITFSSKNYNILVICANLTEVGLRRTFLFGRLFNLELFKINLGAFNNYSRIATALQKFRN